MAEQRPLADYRVGYGSAGLEAGDLPADPLSAFLLWFADAEQAALAEPNAMILATADASGGPSARTVLLKEADGRGFAFFTNLGSRKSRELLANPRAAAVFPWHAMHRQVCVAGDVTAVPDDEADAYFATRPRGSQLGAWTSRQSEVLESRAQLDAQAKDVEEMFEGKTVPKPEFWGGWRLEPETVEFWQGRESRLHDRIRFRRRAIGASLDDATGWIVERLSP
jgi:pyridoxamine 5'-phosphate oxidase